MSAKNKAAELSDEVKAQYEETDSETFEGEKVLDGYAYSYSYSYAYTSD